MKHCWHWTGETTHHWTAGTDTMICCKCGHHGYRKWEIEAVPVAGHGQYWKDKIKTYEETRPITGVTEECNGV